MPFHIFRHIEAGQFDPHGHCELTCDFRLTDARWARKQIAANRLLRFTQPGPRHLNRRGKRIDSCVLTEHNGLKITFQAF